MENAMGKLAAALAKAQGEMGGARKDAKNKHLGNLYADLSSCWDACRAALAKHDLAVTQTHEIRDDGTLIVRTTLAHGGGATVSGDTPALYGPAKGLSTMQAMGSALTYARRYGLCAMVGIAPEDDDGATAGTYAPPPRTPRTVSPHISDEQRKRLFAIATEHGHTPGAIKQWLFDEHGAESSTTIEKGAYESICERLSNNTPLMEREPGSEG